MGKLGEPAAAFLNTVAFVVTCALALSMLAVLALCVGFGRVVTLRYRSSTSHQIYPEIRYLYF